MEKNELQVKQIKPHNREAEQTVLGSMLLDNECIQEMGDIVTGQDFYTPMYGLIYDTMLELFNEGQPVDVVTLRNRLLQKNVTPEVGSADFISSLIASE